MYLDYLFSVLLLAVLFIFSVLAYLSGGIKRRYHALVLEGLKRTADSPKSIVTEKDLEHLPLPVQKYLRYVGIIGKERVVNLRISIEGEMKPDPKGAWSRIEAVQYSFFDDKPTRLFYIKLNMFGVPFVGLHSYTEEMANMLIKALGLVKVVDSRGREARISDTTTMFNDMCLMTPSTLIDQRIQWETIDPYTVKATYEVYGNRVSALLYFNEVGELVNFISDDRYMILMDGSSRKGRWATPVKNYKDFGGFRGASYAETTWLWPEGDYCYGRFTVKSIEYNTRAFK